MLKKITFIEKNLVVILLLFSTIGLAFPQCFFWAKNVAHPMLILIAFCVGLTLNIHSFKDIWNNKRLICTVLTFKYILISLLTFIVCSLTNIPTIYTIGLVILTCCPAANTGNIMCYISKGNTALIITTTIIGALLAPIITPTIIYVLLHKVVHVNFIAMVFIITTAIAIPMLTGVLVNSLFSDLISKIKYSIPSIGILAVSIIIASVLAQHANQLYKFGIKIPLICCFLIILFLTLGFIFSKKIKPSIENAIAMSFEVGTFDGVLGIFLTIQIVNNTATLPVVIFAILNLIIGSIASKIFTSNKFLRLVNEK